MLNNSVILVKQLIIGLKMTINEKMNKPSVIIIYVIFSPFY